MQLLQPTILVDERRHVGHEVPQPVVEASDFQDLLPISPQDWHSALHIGMMAVGGGGIATVHREALQNRHFEARRLAHLHLQRRMFLVLHPRRDIVVVVDPVLLGQDVARGDAGELADESVLPPLQLVGIEAADGSHIIERRLNALRRGGRWRYRRPDG